MLLSCQKTVLHSYFERVFISHVILFLLLHLRIIVIKDKYEDENEGGWGGNLVEKVFIQRNILAFEIRHGMDIGYSIFRKQRFLYSNSKRQN